MGWCIQEHKLRETENLREAEEWCRKRKLKCVFTEAELGSNGGPSGGTAIIVHGDLGLHVPVDGRGPSRMAAAVVEVPGSADFACGISSLGAKPNDRQFWHKAASNNQ